MNISTSSFSSSRPTAYSETGRQLARQGVNSYNRANRWTDADRFVGSSLQSISRDEDTTSDEKALARMGYNLGAKAGMRYENSARARVAVASAIANSAGGPIGAVMAQAVSQAYDSADRWTDADHIIQTGLQAIYNNPSASQLNRDIAELGFDMGNHTGMQWDNSAQARKAAINFIKNDHTTDTGEALAHVSLNAYNSADSWKDADKISGVGLQAILSNPRSSELQKSLAESALDQTNRSGITWENSARSRAETLRQILD